MLSGVPRVWVDQEPRACRSPESPSLPPRLVFPGISWDKGSGLLGLQFLAGYLSQVYVSLNIGLKILFDRGVSFLH